MNSNDRRTFLTVLIAGLVAIFAPLRSLWAKREAKPMQFATLEAIPGEIMAQETLTIDVVTNIVSDEHGIHFVTEKIEFVGARIVNQEGD